MDRWGCPLRYHYCRVHDLSCGFHSLSPSCFLREIKSHFRFTMAAFAIWSYNQTNQNNSKENYPPDDRDRVFDRCIISIPVLDSWKWNLNNMVYPSCPWGRVLFDSHFTGQPILLPSPYGCHWKGLRQLYACSTQRADDTTWPWRNTVENHLVTEFWSPC